MAGSRKDKREVVVKSVELSASCHSTENCDKVRTALFNLIPPELRPEAKIVEEVHYGFYGNKIVLLKTASKEGRVFLKYYSENLPAVEKSILSASFRLRYDASTGRLHLRFSKQDAFMGRMKILDSDDIVKVVVHFSNAKREEDVRNALREIGLIF
ncbi:MAG: RNA-binding domain-containing protein [Thermosphaera sp.]